MEGDSSEGCANGRGGQWAAACRTMAPRNLAMRGERRVEDLPAEVEALRRIPFFEDLTSDDLMRIARIGRLRSFDAGEDIVTRGADDPGLYVLLSGRALVD